METGYCCWSIDWSPYRYRTVKPVIVASETFKDAQRVIDYDGIVSAGLIAEGAEAAQKAFCRSFPM